MYLLYEAVQLRGEQKPLLKVGIQQKLSNKSKILSKFLTSLIFQSEILY